MCNERGLSKPKKGNSPVKEKPVVEQVTSVTDTGRDNGHDTCPECGTNLAARRKERARRREYMRKRRG